MDSAISIGIILVILVLLSAFFSSSETAYSSASLLKLKSYAEEGRHGAKRAIKIAENFDKTISTILIGNNIVNILAASLATVLFSNYFPTHGIWLSTLVMTLTILVFGEVLPKNYAKANSERYAVLVSGPLYFLIKLFTPLSYPLVKFNKNVQGLYDEEPSVTEAELISMMEVIEEEGVIEEEERELIQSALRLDDTNIGQILTTRQDVVAIELGTKLDDIKQLMLEQKYSRIPVYEDSVDNIVGILYERDLFSKIVQEKKRISVKRLMRDPIFVTKSMKVAALVKYLRKNKAHMAVVLDEYGTVAGVVTLEDALEELVGEIYDEHDEVPQFVKKESNGTLTVDADIELKEFFEEYLNVDSPKSKYHNLGGWVYEVLEEIPAKGKEFEYNDYNFLIKKVDDYRIKKILVSKKESEVIENK